VGLGRDNTTLQNLNRPPKYAHELPTEWKEANNSRDLQIHMTDKIYCVYCTYVVSLTNTYKPDPSVSFVTGETKFQLIV